MIRHVAVLALVLGCNSSAPPSPSPPPPPAPGTITGHLALAPGAKLDHTRGTLFISWVAEADRKALVDHSGSPTLVRDVITHGTVVGDVDAGHDVPFTV